METASGKRTEIAESHITRNTVDQRGVTGVVEALPCVFELEACGRVGMSAGIANQEQRENKEADRLFNWFESLLLDEFLFAG